MLSSGSGKWNSALGLRTDLRKAASSVRVTSVLLLFWAGWGSCEYHAQMHNFSMRNDKCSLTEQTFSEKWAYAPLGEELFCRPTGYS